MWQSLSTSAEEVIDIGIITPYRDQAKLITALLQDNEWPTFPVSTVHKFQGRENDVIILSTVSNEIQEFIDDPHLLNVAVSRAKKKFIQTRVSVSQYESENIMFALLEQIVSMPEWNHLGIMPQYPLRLLVKSDILLTESEEVIYEFFIKIILCHTLA